MRVVREGGRLSTGWLNRTPSDAPWSPMVSVCRPAGRWSSGWLNSPPRTKVSRVDGRKSSGWLKYSRNQSFYEKVSLNKFEINHFQTLLFISFPNRHLFVSSLFSLFQNTFKARGRLSRGCSQYIRSKDFRVGGRWSSGWLLNMVHVINVCGRWFMGTQRIIIIMRKEMEKKTVWTAQRQDRKRKSGYRPENCSLPKLILTSEAPEGDDLLETCTLFLCVTTKKYIKFIVPQCFI